MTKWTVTQNCVIICTHIDHNVFPALRCPSLCCVTYLKICTRPHDAICNEPMKMLIY
jgi:hypothetical protein